MNQYGHREQARWKTERPSQYTQIPDPTAFFTQLGEGFADQVQGLIEEWAGTEEPQEDYLATAGRQNMARVAAEAQVLREAIALYPPE